jgi:hypothetical protein
MCSHSHCYVEYSKTRRCRVEHRIEGHLHKPRGNPSLDSAVPYNRKMAEKLIKLRYQGACHACTSPLPQGTTAWWDQGTHSLECTVCRPESGHTSSPSSPCSLIEIDRGVPGASSQVRYERGHAERERELERKWGRLSGLVKFLTDDPQSIRVWKTGSGGERKLAASLEHLVGDRAVLLSDRRVPGTSANIDHIAVASSGVWVIDAKRYKGLIELRDVGGWFRVDRQLYVNGRRRTKLVDDLAWQMDAVLNALGSQTVPVYAALCFVDGEWRLFAKPFELKGVFVSWPKRLAEVIAENGPLKPEDVLVVASRLSLELPSKSTQGRSNRRN